MIFKMDFSARQAERSIFFLELDVELAESSQDATYEFVQENPGAIHGV